MSERQDFHGETQAELHGTVPGLGATLTAAELKELANAVHPSAKHEILDRIRARRREAEEAAPELTLDELEAAGFSTPRSEKRREERHARMVAVDEGNREAERQRYRDAAGLGDLLPRLAAMEERISALEARRK